MGFCFAECGAYMSANCLIFSSASKVAIIVTGATSKSFNLYLSHHRLFLLEFRICIYLALI